MIYPLIYQLPKLSPIKINQNEITFDDQIQPKLLKYGSNYMIDNLPLLNITSSKHHTDMLPFNLPQSITPFKNQLNQTTMELIEILTLFNLIKKNQSFSSNVQPKDILTELETLFKIKIPSEKKASIVFHKFSEIDIDENIWINLIMGNINNIFSSVQKDGNVIIQLFSFQTKAAVDILYYLSSLAKESFIIKPSVISDVFDCKYLVLLNVTEVVPKINPVPKNLYLASLLSDDLTKLIPTIQNVNSILLSKKFISFHKFNTYISDNTIGGIKTQSLKKKQIENMDNWINTFTTKSDQTELMEKIISTK